MSERINGASSAMQVVSGDLQTYICYASSPGAYSNPDPNPSIIDELGRLVNIMTTGNPRDLSQKNFELLLMTVGLRAMPVVISDPLAVPDLSAHTAELSGEGFIWKFSVEQSASFYNFTNFGTPGPVGLLIDEVDGLFLPGGVRVTTKPGSSSGWAQNVTFVKATTI